MVDGSYQVMLKTPMGVKKGELILQSAEGILSGAMIVMGKENQIGSGKTDGSAFSFSGEIKTAVGKLPYECTGNVTGDELTGIAKTPKGNLSLSGKRK